MYKINDAIVYRKDTCKIVDIKDINNVKYYVLIPINDESLKINVPADSDKIRNVISKEKVNEIINSIPNIPLIEETDRMMENTYKSLMQEGSFEGLIQIIKTTYLRNISRLNNNKHISERDNTFFKEAEKYLYTEFSVALGMNYDDTKKYVINILNELEANNEE